MRFIVNADEKKINAETQRRRDAEKMMTIYSLCSLSLCVKIFISSLRLCVSVSLRLIFKFLYSQIYKKAVYVCFFLTFLVMTGCGPQISRLQEEKREETYAYTPPPTVTAVPSPRPVPPAVVTPDVLIDPGHGGKDLGTHSEGKIFYEEKSAVLMTSKLVGRRLTEMGYNVSFTRRDDSFIDLKQRVHYSELRRPQIFVSIHYNSAPTPKAEGIEIFYYKGEKEDIRSRASKLLAQDVLASVVDTTKAKSRGVKNGNLHVIRENPRPAILIEAGFLTNKEERQHIYSKSYQEKLAQGIADGIDKYLQRNAQKAVKIGVGY